MTTETIHNDRVFAYEKDGTTMIVSRGLARESTRIPRFYNRPELVIVDIISQR